MKLEPVPSTKTWKAPSWFKRHPKTGVYYVEAYKAHCHPQRITRSTGVDGPRDYALRRAEQIYAEWCGEGARGAFKPNFSMLCEDVLERQKLKLENQKIRKTTYDKSVYYVSELREHFGPLDPNEMVPTMWTAFCIEYQKKKPGKTLYNFWKHLNLVMNYAHKNGLISRKWEVENPDKKKKAGRVFSQEEKTQILKHASPDFRDQLLMAMTMGMRKREILSLAWSEVDFQRRTLTVLADKNKNKKTRTIRLSPQVEAALMKRQAFENGSRFVFPSHKDPETYQGDNKTAWKATKRRAFITGRARFHDLRHTFVSETARLVKEGSVSLVLVTSYIDMSIKIFEQVYLHLTHDDTAPVAELIAVKLRENGETNDAST